MEYIYLSTYWLMFNAFYNSNVCDLQKKSMYVTKFECLIGKLILEVSNQIYK